MNELNNEIIKKINKVIELVPEVPERKKLEKLLEEKLGKNYEVDYFSDFNAYVKFYKIWEVCYKNNEMFLKIELENKKEIMIKINKNNKEYYNNMFSIIQYTDEWTVENKISYLYNNIEKNEHNFCETLGVITMAWQTDPGVESKGILNFISILSMFWKENKEYAIKKILEWFPENNLNKNLDDIIKLIDKNENWKKNLESLWYQWSSTVYYYFDKEKDGEQKLLTYFKYLNINKK